MDIYKWYRISRWLYLHHVPVIPGMIKALIRILWGGGNPLSGRDWYRYSFRLSGIRDCHS